MRSEIKAQTWARSIRKTTGYNVFENTRRREIVTYRSLHVVMCRKNLGWSLERIGKFYRDNGKKSYDHATVLHAERMFEQYCFYDKELMNTMQVLSDMVDDNSIKLSSLQTKLKYIDPEFYDAVDNCMAEAFRLTSLKNEEKIQEDKKRKEEEKLYAL